jgi:hypothetical protein
MTAVVEKITSILKAYTSDIMEQTEKGKEGNIGRAGRQRHVPTKLIMS